MLSLTWDFESQRVCQDRLASDPVVVRLVVSDHGLGLFVPKPNRGAGCLRCSVSDLGTAVRQRPLASIIVSGGCYSLRYSARDYGQGTGPPGSFTAAQSSAAIPPMPVI